MAQTHSHHPKGPAPAAAQATHAAGAQQGAGSAGQGNAALASKLGLAGGAAGAGATAATQLPVAGDYDGKCRIPIILRDNAQPGDELLGLAELTLLGDKWGVAVSADAVRLARKTTAAGAPLVVEVVWPRAWGAYPRVTTTAGVEARLAAVSLAGQPGWASVPAGERAPLEALVGGESNAVSDKARTAYKALLDGAWDTKSVADQAAALTGLLTDKTARPGVVDEDVSHLPAATFTLEGPTVEKNHAFKGATEDADVYDVKFKDEGKTIKIYAPHSPRRGKAYHTVQQAAEAAARLPEGSRKVVVSITLNPIDNPDDAHWAQEYGDPNFHSYMTAGAAGNVTIYPSSGKTPSTNYMRGTMIHETGHTWAYKTWGNDKTKDGWARWKQAMDKDKISVSNYATNSVAEDVAETIQVYGSSQGKPAFHEYRAMVPARFAILDKEL